MEFLLVLLLLPFLIGAFITFNQIIKVQYKENKNEWEASGRPCGFFWKPKEIKWPQGYIARNRLAFIWLFKTPDWIKNNDRIKKDLSRLRLLVLIWNLGIIALLIILLINTKTL